MKIVGCRALGLIVIGAVLYWLSVVVAMHFLEPEFNPVRDPMSAYVLGPYGPWMTTTYVALSAALLGLGYGLAKTLPRTRLTSAACLLFLVAGATTFVAGLFPMDFPPPPRTLSGRLHALGGLLAFPTMTLGTFLFSLSFHCDGYWRAVSVPSLTLSAGIIAALLLGVVSLVILGFGGYAQRLLIALLFAWMIVVSLRLTHFPRTTEESRRPVSLSSGIAP